MQPAAIKTLLPRLTLFGALLFGVTSCGGSTFSSGGAKTRAAKKTDDQRDAKNSDANKSDVDGKNLGNLGNQGDAGKGSGQTSGSTDAANGGDNISDNGQLVQCPKRAQKILIMDFKSGWWAGDGGQFFTKIINGLSSECVGSVSIEYHHIVQSGASVFMGGGDDIMNTTLTVPGGTGNGETGSSNFATAFGDSTFQSYTQIWMLSGAGPDPMDLKPGNPFLEQVLTATQGSSANVFIGTGFGSITTGNALTSRLGMGQVFTTTNEEGRLLNPMAGVAVSSVLKVGGQLKQHVLFSRGIADIADNLVVGGEPATGDSLGGGGGLPVIGADSQGKPCIAAGQLGARKIVLDAGMHRYYAIWKDASAGTFQLLKNVIVYLSK